MKGLDVYVGSGKINYKKAKEDGYDFVIVKAGQGHSLSSDAYLFADKNLKDNIKGAKEAGLLVGVYWFFTGDSYTNTIREAEAFIDFIKPYKQDIDLWAVCDAEAYSGNVWLKNLSKKDLTQNIDTFCKALESAGYKPMVYTNPDHVKNYIEADDLPYPFWVASYASKPPKVNVDKFYIWQNSDSGRIDGTTKNVDTNQLMAKEYVSQHCKLKSSTIEYFDDYEWSKSLWDKLAHAILFHTGVKTTELQENIGYLNLVCRSAKLSVETHKYLCQMPDVLNEFRKIYLRMLH